MEGVNPSEIEVEKMANELATCGDLGPWDRRSWWTRALTTEAVLLLALHFKKLDYIDQPMMSGRRSKALCETWVFMVEPLSDGLVRLAPTKSADDLPVVAVAPNSA